MMRATVTDDGVQRRAAHQFHRDPQSAVGFGTKAVHVGSEWVVELRGQSSFTKKAIGNDRSLVSAAGHHFDDGFAPEGQLLGPIHFTTAALTQALAENEVAKGPTFHT